MSFDASVGDSGHYDDNPNYTDFDPSRHTALHRRRRARSASLAAGDPRKPLGSPGSARQRKHSVSARSLDDSGTSPSRVSSTGGLGLSKHVDAALRATSASRARRASKEAEEEPQQTVVTTRCSGIVPFAIVNCVDRDEAKSMCFEMLEKRGVRTYVMCDQSIPRRNKHVTISIAVPDSLKEVQTSFQVAHQRDVIAHMSDIRQGHTADRPGHRHECQCKILALCVVDNLPTAEIASAWWNFRGIEHEHFFSVAEAVRRVYTDSTWECAHLPSTLVGTEGVIAPSCPMWQNTERRVRVMDGALAAALRAKPRFNALETIAEAESPSVDPPSADAIEYRKVAGLAESTA